MYINQIPFMVTKSRAIQFEAAKMIKNEKMATITKSIQQIINTCQGRGFRIKHLLGDGQFNEVERYFRIIEARVCTTGNALSFENRLTG